MGTTTGSWLLPPYLVLSTHSPGPSIGFPGSQFQQQHKQQSLQQQQHQQQQHQQQHQPTTPVNSTKGRKRHLDHACLDEVPPPETKRRSKGQYKERGSPSNKVGATPSNKVGTTPSNKGADSTVGCKPVIQDPLARVSDGILKYFEEHRQSKEVFQRKMALRDRVYRLLQRLFPACGLYVVGSSMNGLGSNQSDMDMCLMLTPCEVDQRNEAITVLQHASRILNQADFITKTQLIYAKVPILKFSDKASGVEMDLNVNNAVGIRNTQLLNCYSRLDSRVAPLALVIKAWASRHGINDAKLMTLSSYSLVLMLIHYLQFGCQPCVLPCLQTLVPVKFKSNSDVRTLNLYEDLPNFHSENKQSLGELLRGFLHYYTKKFNFSTSCISVRQGGCISREAAASLRSSKNTRTQWKYICIEEPFDRTNTARSVFDYNAFRLIQTTFQNSLALLEATCDLDCLLPPYAASRRSF